MASHRVDRILNSIKSTPVKTPKATPLGSPGYDNPREDIEKVKKIRELVAEKLIIQGVTDPFVLKIGDEMTGDLILKSADLILSEGAILKGTIKIDSNSDLKITASGKTIFKNDTGASISEYDFDVKTIDDSDVQFNFISNGSTGVLTWMEDEDRFEFADDVRISGSLGVGITTPDGTLHVHTATAGTVTPSVHADDLVVENSDNAGMTILTPNNKISRIFFGSPEDPTGAKIQWDNTNNVFHLGSSKTGATVSINSGNDVEALEIDSSQNFNFRAGTLTTTGVVNFPHAQTAPARVLGTIYQNTTGHPIIVYGDILCAGLNNANNFVELKTDSSTPPTTVVQKVGEVSVFLASTHLRSLQFSFYMVIADNDYYRIDITGNDVTLGHWNEVNF